MDRNRSSRLPPRPVGARHPVVEDVPMTAESGDVRQGLQGGVAPVRLLHARGHHRIGVLRSVKLTHLHETPRQRDENVIAGFLLPMQGYGLPPVGDRLR